jgi:hypothetical protein
VPFGRRWRRIATSSRSTPNNEWVLRKCTHANIKYVIAKGDVIEQHPDNRPDPKALFMAYVDEEPLYVSCAFDGSYAYIITVHRYDADRWIGPWTRRKE